MIVLRPSSERTGATAASGKSAAICARESSSSASCSRRSLSFVQLPLGCLQRVLQLVSLRNSGLHSLCRVLSRISVAWIFPSSGSPPSRSFFAFSSWVRKRILAGCKDPIFDSRSESILAVSGDRGRALGILAVGGRRGVSVRCRSPKGLRRGLPLQLGHAGRRRATPLCASPHKS